MNYTLFAILAFFQLGWSFVKSNNDTGVYGYTAYDGPTKWGGQCQKAITSYCTAIQTPINIVDRFLFSLPSRSSIDASNAHPSAYKLVVVNTGHAGHTVLFSA